ncbi:MAG: sigma-70 family RNA polymerase sigma factor [Ferruginibacter sp.]
MINPFHQQMEVYDTYAPYVLGKCLTYFKSYGEDAAQEIWLSIFKNWKSDRIFSREYFRRIILRKIYKRTKKDKVKRERFIRWLRSAKMVDDEQDTRIEYRQLMRLVLKNLKEKEIQLLRLKYYYGYETREIGELLDKDPGPIDTQLSRICTRVKEMFTTIKITK